MQAVIRHWEGLSEGFSTSASTRNQPSWPPTRLILDVEASEV